MIHYRLPRAITLSVMAILNEFCFRGSLSLSLWSVSALQIDSYDIFFFNSNIRQSVRRQSKAAVLFNKTGLCVERISIA